MAGSFTCASTPTLWPAAGRSRKKLPSATAWPQALTPSWALTTGTPSDPTWAEKHASPPTPRISSIAASDSSLKAAAGRASSPMAIGSCGVGTPFTTSNTARPTSPQRIRVGSSTSVVRNGSATQPLVTQPTAPPSDATRYQFRSSTTVGPSATWTTEPLTRM